MPTLDKQNHFNTLFIKKGLVSISTDEKERCDAV